MMRVAAPSRSWSVLSSVVALMALCAAARAQGQPSGSITNTAIVSSTTGDPAPGNNSSSAVVAISVSADLAVSLSGPARALPGGDVAYSLTVTNGGPSDASSVSAALATPPGLAFVSSAGDCTTAFPCALGDIPAGGARSVDALFRISARYAGPRSFTATATVSSAATPDLATGNDRSDATTRAASIASDFDRDGQTDILWHNQSGGDLYLWLLDGTVTRTGGYLDPPRFADTRWQIRGLADFNGDGKTDVLWHHRVSGDLYVWFLDGGRTVDGLYLTPRSFSDTRWQIRGVDDFNGDGKPDILWHHQGTGELYVWFLDGTVTVAGAYLTPRSFSDTRWQIRAVVDFDGDGKRDILWHHQGTGELYVWYLDGTVTVDGAYLTPRSLADTHWQVRAVADYDADGDPDVLWQNRVHGDLYVWFLDGTVAVEGGYLTPKSLPDPGWHIAPR